MNATYNPVSSGAHDTLDRLADSATPALRQLGDRVSAVSENLHEKTAQLRQTGDEWVESARSTVRRNPLVSLGAAVVLGAVIARIAR